MTWIDISQPLTNDIGHWPGVTPFSYSLTHTKQQIGSANIGKITTCLHTGTHVDAPFHFDDDGKTIEQLPIESFIGRARVVDISHLAKITPDDFRDICFQHVSKLLLKTSLPNNPKKFPEEIPEMDFSIASFLQRKGVQLLGVDLPSVDPLTSKELPTHHAPHQHGIHILENIMLDHVEEGIYELIALPLAIHGGDGSPVRAVIKRIKELNIHE